MGHRSARLTEFGRELLVRRVLDEDWAPAAAAEASGVSRATVYKWLARFEAEGFEGLADRSSRPRRSPRRLSRRVEKRVLSLRRREKLGPHGLASELKMPRSTCYAVLRRHGMQRLAWMDRPTGQVIRRYERERPGDLIHVDVKKLGRIPKGGGHRIHGRSGHHGSGQGYDKVHSAVDDHTRLAYSEIHADETGATCAGFLRRATAFFADRGFTVREVMTDNAMNYVLDRHFRHAITELGQRHITTRPYRPQTNGKVERFNRTLLDEWAYVRPYTSNAQRTKLLDRWLHRYNYHRSHTALGGLPPISRVNNLCGNYS